MATLPRRLIAEAFGTFALVFFGCASVVVDMLPGGHFGLMGIALAHAIALSVAVSATMAISGGQLNPALTIGLLVTRRMDLRSALAYIVVQLLAAVVAVLAVRYFFPAAAAKAVSYGVPGIANTLTLGQAIGLEALLTFFLMSAVYGTAISPDAPRIGGFGIGLTLFFCILVAGPLTGGALNPARAFGPAIVSKVWVGHIAYWIGPILGAVLAGLLWEWGLMPRKNEEA
jgi:MIP family channel proteins